MSSFNRRERPTRRCADDNLPGLEFQAADGFAITIRRKAREVAGEVTPEVAPEVRVTLAVKGAMSRRELQAALGLRDDEHFRTAYLVPALNASLIEMTIPDKPTSRRQKYRLTDEGRAVRDATKRKNQT